MNLPQTAAGGTDDYMDNNLTRDDSLNISDERLSRRLACGGGHRTPQFSRTFDSSTKMHAGNSRRQLSMITEEEKTLTFEGQAEEARVRNQNSNILTMSCEADEESNSGADKDYIRYDIRT